MAETEELKDDAPFDGLPPTCPRCGKDITRFSFARVTTGQGLHVQMFYCQYETCRCLFTAQVIGQKSVAQQPVPQPLIALAKAMPKPNPALLAPLHKR